MAGDDDARVHDASPRRTAAASLLGIAIAVAYADIVRSLIRDWATDGNYSHAFVVAPLAAWVIWRRRGQLRSTPLHPNRIGIVVVAISLSLLGAGRLGVELFLARLSLVGVAAGSILFVCGTRHLRLCAFPLLLLALTIPLPAIVLNQIALPLQSLTSRGAVLLLAAAHVPVLREGHTIIVPGAALEVEEACSGLRSIVSLVTIAIVAAHMFDYRMVRVAALAMATVPIAVVANALRVAGLSVAGYYLGVDVVHSPLHDLAGYGGYLLSFLILWSVNALWISARRFARPEAAPC